MTLDLQLYLKLMKNYQMRIILDVFFRMRDRQFHQRHVANTSASKKISGMRVEQFDVNVQDYYAWNSISDSMD